MVGLAYNHGFRKPSGGLLAANNSLLIRAITPNSYKLKHDLIHKNFILLIPAKMGAEQDVPETASDFPPATT
jgi:hypothetical protein